MDSAFEAVLQQVIPEVHGLKWGSYVGSPAEPEPVIVWRRNHRSTIGLFVPLTTNDVFGLCPMSCLIVSYSKEKGNDRSVDISVKAKIQGRLVWRPCACVFVSGSTLFNTTYVTAAALVTWGHFDGLLRVKFRKDHQLLPIIKPCPLDAVMYSSYLDPFHRWEIISGFTVVSMVMLFCLVTAFPVTTNRKSASGGVVGKFYKYLSPTLGLVSLSLRFPK